MNKMVSIIIPTYNHDYKLKKAIESVLNQSYQNFEVIVVDNHSTDDTDIVLASFTDSRIKVYKINNHGVIAASRNAGLRAAQGDYIAFLDSDDWWKKEKLTLSLEKLQEGYDFVYHDMWLCSAENQKRFFKKVGARKLHQPAYEDLLVRGNAIPNSSVVFKRMILDQIGLISEDNELKGVEDFDYWLKIAQLTEAFYCLPQVLGYYWYGGGNFSSFPKQFYIGLLKLKELHYDTYVKSNGLDLPFYLSYRIAKYAKLTGNMKEYMHQKRNLKNQKLTLVNWLKVKLL